MEDGAWRREVVVRRHPRAKYVRLKIHRPGRVEVVVPPGFDERDLPAILDHHSAWVDERLGRFDAPHGPQAALFSRPTEFNLQAIDEQWRLEYRPRSGGRNGCREFAPGQLAITAEHDTERRELLRGWLQRRAKERLPAWLRETSRELELPFTGVTIRGQRSRWGSCSAAGNINLNYGLLFLPPDLVRYLFVHELCHTVHLNHSLRYWALVQSKEPHYKILERALKQAAHVVPAWLHQPFGG
ncbi:MAG: M48 family metallopeptidase [Gammaproteobacteria bacterium]|nr:M48 family metallopeptidase [Gammaproteobacteria bacterium]